MQIIPQCHDCEHYRGGAVCAAFTDIPNAILVTGEHDHRDPFKGDGGVRFKPLTKDK